MVISTFWLLNINFTLSLTLREEAITKSTRGHKHVTREFLVPTIKIIKKFNVLLSSFAPIILLRI